jgi:GDP-4-dehydro-6-deoxy-D-mannose reductase
MSKTILITGVSGFVGSHLLEACNNFGLKVIGIGITEPKNLKTNNLYDYIKCDLANRAETRRLKLPKLQSIIHLAGFASQAASFNEPSLYISNNPAMFVNLVECVKAQNHTPRIIAISSGAVYDSQQSMPINESGLVKPSSPYIISKLIIEYMASYYRGQGLDCIVVRPFNHTGPCQGNGYILPDLVTEVKKAVSNNKLITTGNLETRRDYSDVRDVVNAYLKLATTKSLAYEIYNVASGKTVSGKELLDIIIKNIAPKINLKIVVDKAKFRADDPFEICGDSQRIRKELSWQPLVPLEKTVSDYITGLTKK